MMQETTIEITADYLPKNLEQEINHCIANHDVLYVNQPDGKSFVIIGAEDWEEIKNKLFL